MASKKVLLYSLLSATAFMLFSLYACKDKKDDFTIEYAYEYYPLDTGHYVIYDVDSIVYNYNSNVHTNDTVHYQLKELLADTFYDNLNELTYRLELYRRPDNTAPWGLDRVWYVKRSNNTIQKTEDDLKFIKLIFPPTEGAEWSGNQYLPTTEPYKDFKDWVYTNTDVNKPYTVNGFVFDSTLTVIEINDSTKIDKQLRKEVYAKHVGMIYQEWELLSKQNVLPTSDWDKDPEKGFRIRMRLVEHN